MTLTPEPRPARRPFATTKDAGWTSRADMEALEQKFIVETIYAHHGLLAKQAAAINNLALEMQAAADQVTTAFSAYFGDILVWAGSPRSRRRHRKQLRLAAHHQKKLDRVPTWKRTDAKGTR